MEPAHPQADEAFMDSTLTVVTLCVGYQTAATACMTSTTEMGVGGYGGNKGVFGRSDASSVGALILHLKNIQCP